MASNSFLLFTIATLTLASAQEKNIVKITSHLDGNVITSTEYLEDPGPYNVYATKAEPYSSNLTQQWAFDELNGKTRSFSPRGGHFLNSFSTFKPCPRCFAANEVWRILPVKDNYVVFQSTWNDLCFTNTRNYLKKETCNSASVSQQWKMETLA